MRPVNKQWQAESHRVRMSMRSIIGEEISEKDLKNRGVAFYVNINTPLAGSSAIHALKNSQDGIRDINHYSLDDMLILVKELGYEGDQAMFWLNHYLIRSHEMFKIFRERRLGIFNPILQSDGYRTVNPEWVPIEENL